jgi:serine/threonine protein kinase
VTGKLPWDVNNMSKMMREMFNGSFQIPTFVSSECQDLISKMLQVNPQKRTSIDDILNHPWIQQSKRNQWKLSKKRCAKIQSLPLLFKLNLEDISKASEKNSTDVNNGIHSPFVNSVRDESSLPKLCLQSSNLESLLREKTVFTCQTAKKAKISRIGLHNSPQIFKYQNFKALPFQNSPLTQQ